MNKDIVIVGAGPAGLYTSLYIKNRDVLLVEEHSYVGKPKHCTGIIGSKIARDIVAISPKLLDSEYKRIIFLLENKKLELEFKYPLAYHVNRPLLEEKLAEKTESLGHVILYRTKAKPSSIGTIETTHATIKSNIVVASDGANSEFRRRYTNHRPVFLHGVQVIAKNASLPTDTIVIYYSNDIPGFFAWITPIRDDYLQIGYASKITREKILQMIAKKTLGVELTGIRDRYGGLIPIHRPLENPILFNKLVFHGDSVPLIKPYTGGGLYYIFRLSPILGRLIDSGELSSYVTIYRKIFYYRSLVEHSVTNVLRQTRYHLPAEVVKSLYDIGFLSHQDFDNHYGIILKSISILPALVFLLFS